MTNQMAIIILKIERECVKRNIQGCDRDCAKCDLVQTDEELLEMYDYVIEQMKGGAERIRSAGRKHLWNRRGSQWKQNLKYGRSRGGSCGATAA